MNIVGFQTTNDVYVIAELIANDDFLTVKNPLTVMMDYNEERKVILRMVPYCIHADSYDDSSASCECKFEKSGILSYYTPSKQLLREYDKIFGTGIIIPDKNIMM